MGRWGPKIFQNDISGIVKETYLGNLKMGRSDEDAFVQTINKMSEQVIRGLTDEIDMWLALASVMFDCGRLNDVAKETALKYTDDPQEINRWLGKSRSERIKVLDELREKLNSQQPDRKEIRVLKRIEPAIRPNEIYYFELNKDNPYYKLTAPFNSFILLFKFIISFCKDIILFFCFSIIRSFSIFIFSALFVLIMSIIFSFIFIFFPFLLYLI